MTDSGRVLACAALAFLRLCLALGLLGSVRIRPFTSVRSEGSVASLRCIYSFPDSEPEVRGFMFWKNVPSQPKMTDPSYAAWIDSQAICP